MSVCSSAVIALDEVSLIIQVEVSVPPYPVESP